MKKPQVVTKYEIKPATASTNNMFEIVAVESVDEYKPEPSFPWDRTTTKLLIKCYASLKEQFRDPKTKKRDLWLEIAEKFHQENYNVSADALDRKWRNIKKRYITIRDTIRKTGRRKISWEYYSDMHDIYSDDCPINLPRKHLTISSSSYVAPTDESLTLPGSSTAPTTSGGVYMTSKKHDKAATMRGLHGLRKRLVDIEEKRVDEIKKLRLAIEKSQTLQEKAQTIQSERNDILRDILDKLNSS